MLNFALRYLELGFSIHPCCPADHRCASPGKIPFDLDTMQHMKGWQNHDTPTEEEVRGWYEDPKCRFNLGFLCGKRSFLIAIDVDSDDSLEMLREESGEAIWATWQYRTGRGFRILYRMPGGMDSAKSYILTRGKVSLEILGDGRQSVLPPSLHPSGVNYEWIEGFSPKNFGEAAIAPDWLVKLGERVVSIGSGEERSEDWSNTLKCDIPQGTRDTNLTRIAGHLFAPQCLPHQEVYEILLSLNKTRCKPPLPDSDIRKIVKSIGQREATQEVTPEGLTADQVWQIKMIARKLNLSFSDAEAVYWQEYEFGL